MRINPRTATALIALLFLMKANATMEEPATVEIRVRILRCWNGEPWKGIEVTLGGVRSAEAGGIRTRDIVFQLRAKTGPDGVAHFRVATPLPPRLIPDAPVAGCGGIPEVIRSDEVLRSGIVERPRPGVCKIKKGLLEAAKPEPGEILFFAARLPWP